MDRGRGHGRDTAKKFRLQRSKPSKKCHAMYKTWGTILNRGNRLERRDVAKDVRLGKILPANYLATSLGLTIPLGTEMVPAKIKSEHRHA